MAPRPTRRRHSAFTLVELLVVLAIVVIMAGALVPSLAGLGRAGRLKSGVRTVAAQLRFAREAAVTRNIYTRFELDVTNGRSQVLELVSRDEQREPEWVESGQADGAVVQLPDGLRFDRTVAADERAATSVLFGPDGRGEAWFVVLSDRDGNRLAVRVKEALGTVSILDPGDSQTYEELQRSAETQR